MRMLLILALVVASPAAANQLNPLTPLSRVAKPSYADYARLGLTGVNKPDGMFYRLRTGITPELPPSIPRRLFGCDLVLADSLPDGFLTLYKSPYIAGRANSGYQAALYSRKGDELWRLNLSSFLSRPTELEVQDMHFTGGQLVFNEACITYPSEAQGQCSALISLDPVSQRETWRTAHLISNNIFLVHGDRIYAGYGFTGEEDYLHILDAASGRLLSKTKLDSAHEYMEIKGDVLVTVTYRSVYTFPLP